MWEECSFYFTTDSDHYTYAVYTQKETLEAPNPIHSHYIMRGFMHCYVWIHADRIQAGIHSSAAECAQQDINNPAAWHWKQTLHVASYAHRKPINTRVLQCVNVSLVTKHVSTREQLPGAPSSAFYTILSVYRFHIGIYPLEKCWCSLLMFTASDRGEINREMCWDDDSPDTILKLPVKSLLLKKIIPKTHWVVLSHTLEA